QEGNDHPTAIPTGVFATRDGHVNLAAAQQPMFKRLCEVLGKPEWLADERFVTGGGRSRPRVELQRRIGAVLATQPSAHWIALFNEAGVPCGPIYAIDQVFADPQVQALDLVKTVEHDRLGRLRLVGQPLVMSRAAGGDFTAAPDSG